jgi:cytochrome P450
VIVDELIDFMNGGTKTTDSTTQAILSHFATDKQSLARVRAEFDQATKDVVRSDTDSHDSKLKKVVTMDTCGDMSYLGYVIQESLRLMPVAPVTAPMYFMNDMTLGKYKVKADDQFVINFDGLGTSST